MRRRYNIELVEMDKCYDWVLFRDEPYITIGNTAKRHNGRSVVYSTNGVDYSGVTNIEVRNTKRVWHVKAFSDAGAIRKMKRQFYIMNKTIARFGCGL